MDHRAQQSFGAISPGKFNHPLILWTNFLNWRLFSFNLTQLHKSAIMKDELLNLISSKLIVEQYPQIRMFTNVSQYPAHISSQSIRKQ